MSYDRKANSDALIAAAERSIAAIDAVNLACEAIRNNPSRDNVDAYYGAVALTKIRAQEFMVLDARFALESIQHRISQPDQVEA